MKRSSFITHLKIQFLLLFIGCRKVLGKQPDLKVRNIFMEKGYRKYALKTISYPFLIFVNSAQNYKCMQVT